MCSAPDPQRTGPHQLSCNPGKADVTYLWEPFVAYLHFCNMLLLSLNHITAMEGLASTTLKLLKYEMLYQSLFLALRTN